MGNTIEQLVVQIEWKATDDSNVLVGYASTFGNVDLGGDVVVRGAFTKSIQRIKKEGIPLLADHVPATTHVLGTIFDAKEDQLGLKIWARLSSAPSAQDIKTKLVEGHLNRMSIGYETLRDAYEERDGRRVRLLEEVKLWETSVVVFPMNPEAVISRVKSVAAELTPADRKQLVEQLADDVPAVAEMLEEGREEKATANETWSLLSDAVRSAHAGDGDVDVWVRDYDDGKVWYSVFTDEGSETFERSYELDDDERTVTLGDATAVRPVTTYLPIDDGAKAVDTTSPAGAPGHAAGDEPAAQAAKRAAAADDESAPLPDEGTTWDRYASEAVLAGRDPKATATAAERAGLSTRLDLLEQSLAKANAPADPEIRKGLEAQLRDTEQRFARLTDPRVPTEVRAKQAIEQVRLRARMELLRESLAELDTLDSPAHPDVRKGLETQLADTESAIARLTKPRESLADREKAAADRARLVDRMERLDEALAEDQATAAPDVRKGLAAQLRAAEGGLRSDLDVASAAERSALTDALSRLEGAALGL